MNHSFKYIGSFVDFKQFHTCIDGIRRHPLEKTIECPHVTFAYRPETVDRDLFGTEIAITILGYGNDGENEGVLVRLDTENDRLQEMIKQIDVPHITIAISRDGKAVNTRNLRFQAIPPITITGIMGGYQEDGTVCLSKYNA